MSADAIPLITDTTGGGTIRIRGAREHNLKNIDVTLPRNRLIVITGLSGSGKSTLAFDTLYAEGQRRYVESLSAYARQFLERLEKPDVEAIDGLSPAIAIEQRTVGGNPRSTIATQTEIYDYLRVLFARAGQPHCPACRLPISRQSAQEIVAHVLELPSRTEVLIVAPLIRGRKGEHAELLRDIKRQGFVRVRVDGRLHDLDEPIPLDKRCAHTIEAVVDRLTLEDGLASRLTESIETALKVGKGLVVISVGPLARLPVKLVRQMKTTDQPAQQAQRNNELIFSELYACARCGFSVEEISPRIFSFNSPYGACPSCDGLGTRLEIDPDLVIPDRSRSLRGGAIEPWRRGGMHMMMYYTRLLREVADHYGLDMDIPFRRIDRAVQRSILYGTDEPIWDGPFEGVIPNLERRFRQTQSDYVKEEIARYMSVLPCPACRGARLKPASLSVLVNGRSIQEATALSVAAAQAWIRSVRWRAAQRPVAEPITKEITQRLQFLLDVGLGYLTLDRPSATLSGGEAQRIRLATQVGSGLVGVLYILDEPSIGLHPRDNGKLLGTLTRLRDLGNTVIVVEHDEETIRHADYVVDLGPGAGKHGGEVVAAGTVPEVLDSPKSLTAQYLTRVKGISVPATRRSSSGRSVLVIKNAQEHNLKGIDVAIPLGLFVCVTGVSGSGKSTVVDDILYRALAKRLHGAKEKPGRHETITGIEHVDQIIVIDQSPIGRTPRSNPATYTGALGPIRELFSQTPEARLRGFAPGRFSFNVKGGRCEACEGDGIKRIEMHFLPDVYVRCEVCKGRRFNDATLQVTYRGRSIADVLAMTVEEAVELFANIPAIGEKLRTIHQVGLDYIELGQPATTLSGGEAQRIKLSKELSKRATGRTLYLLDEPTTGLHFADVEKLLGVLHRLVDQGNTVVVIEHNLEVVKTADHVIDLGPEGGEAGGRVVACGTPEELTKVPASHTGRFLKRLLFSFLFILGLGLAPRCAGAQAQEPAPAEAQASYAAIQGAFLREDFAEVVRLVERLKPPAASGPLTLEDVRISLWYALSLERLQRTNEALRELDRVRSRLSAEVSHASDVLRLWPEVWFWEGEISRRAFQTLRARRAYQRLLTEFPTSTWRAPAQLGLGLTLFQQQAYEAAREQVREVGRGAPELPITREALLLEGLCLLKLRGFGEAVTLFQDMLGAPLDPLLKAQATLYLGESLAGLERFDEATATYQQVIDMDPDSGWARFARFGIGWARFQQHRWREALEAFNGYVKGLPPPARRAADLPWAGSQDIASAAPPTAPQRRGEVSGDAYAELWLAQGRCLMELGDEGAALAHFDALLRDAPHHPLAVDAGLSKAELLQRHEQFADAKALLSSLLRKPLPMAQVLQVHLRLGLLALAQSEAPEAIAQFTSVSRSDAVELRQAAANGLGDAHLVLGDASKARGWYERSVQIAPERPEGLYATYQLGRLLVQDGRLNEAIERFRFVTVHADSVLASDARLALALAYLMSDEADLARTELERLRAQGATEAQMARSGYYLALLAIRAGDAARALQLCEDVIRQAPRSDEAFEAALLLADVTATQRSVEEALHILQASFGSMEGLTARRRGVVAQKMAGWARQAGDYAQAIRWYDAAGRDLPAQRGELDYDAASCYEEAGDLATAAHRYQSLRDDPWRIRGQLAAAKLMERDHEWDGARRLYEGISRQAVPEAKIAQERLAALEELERDEIAESSTR